MWGLMRIIPRLGAVIVLCEQLLGTISHPRLPRTGSDLETAEGDSHACARLLEGRDHARVVPASWSRTRRPFLSSRGPAGRSAGLSRSCCARVKKRFPPGPTAPFAWAIFSRTGFAGWAPGFPKRAFPRRGGVRQKIPDAAVRVPCNDGGDGGSRPPFVEVGSLLAVGGDV